MPRGVYKHKKPGYWKGKKRPSPSLSQRKKISTTLTGRKFTSKHRKNISRGRIGISFSEEHRKNLTLSHLGKRNSNWQGGIYPENLKIRHTHQLRMWSSKVRARDKKCLDCGSKKNLTADHIKSFTSFPKLRLDVENGRTLCRPCHMKTPSWGGQPRRVKLLT